MFNKNISIKENIPLVSIVILNWNGWKDTSECLESIKKNNYQNYNIIVIDNNSSGEDVEILKRGYGDFADIVKSRENLGFTGGNNLGIKKAIEKGSDYILLLNNDTTVKNNFLEELVKTAVSDKKTAIVGSVIADYYTREIIFTNGQIDKKLKFIRKVDYLNSDKEQWETEVVQGSSMMLNTKVFLENNFFLDEDLFLYCEEIDICTRIKKAGFKIKIAGNSIVYHKGGKSYGGGIKPLPVYYTLRNRIILAKKLLSAKDKIIFWILFFPSRVFRSILWIFTGKWRLVRSTYFAFKDGIFNKVGQRHYK